MGLDCKMRSMVDDVSKVEPALVRYVRICLDVSVLPAPDSPLISSEVLSCLLSMDESNTFLYARRAVAHACGVLITQSWFLLIFGLKEYFANSVVLYSVGMLRKGLIAIKVEPVLV